MSCLVVVLFAALTGAVLTAPASDLVKSLPGAPNHTFKQYSGYLSAGGNKRLHYWFVESQLNPRNDPVVLWLNGGPGCSSLLGYLEELGPFHVNKVNPRVLYENPYSWNKFANVLFLESPAGVGFSYIEGSKNYTTNDDETALGNHAAVLEFFAKFPELKKNKFYITGESYGGIYVPTLATRILRYSKDINFVGYAIGNGYLDQRELFNSELTWAFYHALFGKTTWDGLLTQCCKNHDPDCTWYDDHSKECEAAKQMALDKIEPQDQSHYNQFNVYQDCTFQNLSSNTRRPLTQASILLKLKRGQELLDNRPFQPPTLPIDEELPDCHDTDSHLTYYLNQKSVRSALHIPDTVKPWESCSNLNYTNQYKTVRPLILELVKAGKPGVIYNGDVDIVCDFYGDENFVDKLGLPLIQDYQQWYINGDQLAGNVKHYKGITFFTVKGSGHLVPMDKPAAALGLFKRFIGVESD